MNKQLALLLASLFAASMTSGYEVHEWGTFTTVSGSDGENLVGLHVEEEHLPEFVYSHVGMDVNQFMRFGARPKGNQILVVEHEGKMRQHISKGMLLANLRNVTVKMETPVIYFYGDKSEKVNVKVGFNGGTISQWYPQRLRGDTPNKYVPKKGITLDPNLAKLADKNEFIVQAPLDFATPYNGSIEWDVDVIPRADADTAYTFKSDENHTWIYPRVSEAAMLKVGEEYEDFLFYRGIGNFELPAVFSVDQNETLQIKNNSSEKIPFALAFENLGSSVRYQVIAEGVAAGGNAQIPDDGWVTSDMKNWRVDVFKAMRRGLIAQGLSHEEAEGMLKTWWRSYFDKTGLRVFWIVPQVDLARTLPLTLTPSPEKEVRVLVGRADVLRPRFEAQLTKAIGTDAWNTFARDRFAKPYKARLRQIFGKPFYPKLDSEMKYLNVLLEAVGENIESSQSLMLQAKGVVAGTIFGKSASTWQCPSSKRLIIEDLTFNIDAETGILLAQAPERYKKLFPSISHVKIQLPDLLN
ncbi:MAG: hypothetical protein ACI9X0_001543 [Kiritimatiellia bacterium]|jgi:hypothetical protein